MQYYPIEAILESRQFWERTLLQDTSETYGFTIIIIIKNMRHLWTPNADIKSILRQMQQQKNVKKNYLKNYYQKSYIKLNTSYVFAYIYKYSM